jgi:hypothetical protein
MVMKTRYKESGRLVHAACGLCTCTAVFSALQSQFDDEISS